MQETALSYRLKMKFGERLLSRISLVALFWAGYSYFCDAGPYRWYVEAELFLNKSYSPQLAIVFTAVICLALIIGALYFLPSRWLCALDRLVPFPAVEKLGHDGESLLGVVIAGLLSGLYFLSCGLPGLEVSRVDLSEVYSGRVNPGSSVWQSDGRLVLAEDHQWSFAGASHYVPLVPHNWHAGDVVRVVAKLDDDQIKLIKDASGPIEGLARRGALPSYVSSSWNSTRARLDTQGDVYLLSAGSDGYLDRLAGCGALLASLVALFMLWHRIRARQNVN